MDYTKLPRTIIYNDRKRIDNFDIRTPNALDALMFDKVEDAISERCLYNAPTYILDIFNKTYYIVTLIRIENFPLHFVQKYLFLATKSSAMPEISLIWDKFIFSARQ